MFCFLIRVDSDGSQVEESTNVLDDAWNYVVAAMQRQPQCRRYLIERLEINAGSPVPYRIAERQPNGVIVELIPPKFEQPKVMVRTIRGREPQVA